MLAEIKYKSQEYAKYREGNRCNNKDLYHIGYIYLLCNQTYCNANKISKYKYYAGIDVL